MDDTEDDTLGEVPVSQPEKAANPRHGVSKSKLARAAAQRRQLVARASIPRESQRAFWVDVRARLRHRAEILDSVDLELSTSETTEARRQFVRFVAKVAKL